MGEFTIPFKHWRSILQDVIETSYFLIAPFKIGLAILMARLITNNTNFVVLGTDEFNATTSKYSSKAEEIGVSYSLLFIQMGSGIVCTYISSWSSVQIAHAENGILFTTGDRPCIIFAVDILPV